MSTSEQIFQQVDESRVTLQSTPRFEKALKMLARTVALTGVLSASSAGVSNEIMPIGYEIAEASTGDTYPESDASDVRPGKPYYEWGYVDKDHCGAYCDAYNGYTVVDGIKYYIYSERGFGIRNCTDWAAYRAKEMTGVAVPNGASMGNAISWDENGKTLGYAVNYTPEAGDIAQKNSGNFGHVGVVEKVNRDTNNVVTSVEVSEYNKNGDGNYTYATYTKGADGKFGTWENFIDINGEGIGVNGTTNSTASSPTNIVRVDHERQADGANLVYFADTDSVHETWWKPGLTTPATSKILDLAGKTIVDMEAEVRKDGQHLVHTATSDGTIHENWWYPGGEMHTGAIIQGAGNVKDIIKTKGPNGAEQLYVMTDQGVDEYWWWPGGTIQKSRIYTIANPVAMEKVNQANGLQEVYVADKAYVYRNSWGTDGKLRLGEIITHIAQADITSLDYARDADGLNRVYVGRERDGVWETSWLTSTPSVKRTWKVTGDNGVEGIQIWNDGTTRVLYLQKDDVVVEYFWQKGSTVVKGAPIVQGSSIGHFERSVTTDKAQAVYSGMGTVVKESFWFPGGTGVKTSQIGTSS